jgi:hypothetical protein
MSDRRSASVEVCEIAANIERLEVALIVITRLMSSFGDRENKLWEIGRDLKDLKRSMERELKLLLAPGAQPGPDIDFSKRSPFGKISNLSELPPFS